MATEGPIAKLGDNHSETQWPLIRVESWSEFNCAIDEFTEPRIAAETGAMKEINYQEYVRRRADYRETGRRRGGDG